MRAQRGTTPEPNDPQLLSAVIEVAPTPLWVIGPDGLVVLANQAAVDLLGYGSLSEVVGAPSHDVLHEWHPDGTRYPAHSCPILERPRTRAVSDPEWFITRAGRALPVSWSTRPLGVAGQTLLSFADVSEQLRARASRPLTEENRLLRAAADDAGTTSRDALRAELLAHVRSRFRDPDFCAARLAEERHLSLRAVQQLLAEDGRSPAAEIRGRRLELAAQMISRGASVQRAARASGFSETGTFTRAFRRVYGDSPGRWAQGRSSSLGTASAP